MAVPYMRIFPSAPRSQTPSVYIPPLVCETQVLHPYTRKGETKVQYSLLFQFLDNGPITQVNAVFNESSGETSQVQFVYLHLSALNTMRSGFGRVHWLE
jgi:hypothetical protein